MWPLFFAECLIGVAYLFCPGFCLLRAIRIPRWQSVCSAPVFTIFIYSVLSIIYEYVSIPANPLTVFLIPTVVLACLMLAFANHTRQEDDMPLRFVVVYAVVGLMIGLLVFVKNLDGPLSFMEDWDQVHHLNGTRAFAESQEFSFIHNSLNTVDELTRETPFARGGFYPSGWQVICSLLVQTNGIPPTMAINVSNYLFSSLVAPLGFALFLSLVFNCEEKIMFAGSLACVSFAAFPWLLTRWGPVFPNLAAFAALPSVSAIFLRTYYAENRISRKITGYLFFLFGLIGLLLLQPNGAFAAAVMVGSFIVQEALRGELENRLGFSIGGSRVFAGSLIALFAILWFGAFKLPFMRGVVEFNWPSYQSPLQGIINFITIGYVGGFFEASSAQFLLASFVLIGASNAIKESKYRWLLQTYLYWGIVLIVASSTEGIIKHLLGGFWYTDHCRIAAATAIAGVPLASLGIAKAFPLFEKLYSKVLYKDNAPNSALIGAALYVVLVFFPNYHVPGYYEAQTGFGTLYESLRINYAFGPGMIDPEESAFLEEVSSIVPDGAIVANNPYDGSIFAYGEYDIHVLYRSNAVYGGDSESQSSMIVREGISEYAVDESVRDAVEKLGVEYVLLLKVDSEPLNYYSSVLGDGTELWPSLYEIDEDTPGFTLILEDGEMRLYRLDEVQ